MSAPDIERLRSIKSFPSLVKYLRDELEWPIESESFDDLTFDYVPEELGLDPKTAVKVKEIKQLRPLVTNQPWGIFVVNFEPKRLPVVVLRRILRALVLRKRQSANKPQQAAWNLHDLLFISSYGEADHRDITFAHFAEEDGTGDLPTLRVLGWDDEDTVLHLADADKKLREKLRWPEDEKRIEDWRKQWSSTFTLRPREVIGTSKALAERLAELATAIRKRVNKVLAIESESGALRKLMTAFREALIHDLIEDDFADMYAQTITYGLLTARVSRPAGLVAETVAEMVPITNPFLRDMLSTFLTVGGRKGKIDFDELGVNDVVQALRDTDADMEAVLRDFDDKNPEEDPVIHFYELFLKEYDPVKRIKRGVFFTPRPVVSFIVRSVDEILRKEFGLEDGLADTTTWGEMAQRHKDLKIPNGVSPKEPFVQILDPACGTGTFLVEAIEVIYQTMRTKWLKSGHMPLELQNLWSEYVSEHLLPRLYGFELMMAPYAIAHMKLGLKLHGTGYNFHSHERARVYLTNTLEEPKDFSVRFEYDAPALANEAHAVNAIKRHHRFTVVIGNPPYSVSSWNTGDWITNLAEGYKRTVRSEESQIQSLSNDYIKFLRFGEWHTERTGVGILGLITGHGYLHGTQPRDLRAHLSHTFDRCYCLDLHGSVRRTGTEDSEDEPVFQIMTGVAIILGLRTWKHSGQGMTALASLTGHLRKKFAFLVAATILETVSKLPLHRPTQPYFHFAPSETMQNVAEEYQGYLDLPELFGTGNRQSDKEVYWATGFASQQDALAMSFSRSEVEKKMTALADSRSFDELKTSYRLCTTDQWDYSEAKQFASRGLWREYLGQVAYRPFDRRWTVLHRHVLTILRKRVMSQLQGGAKHNLGLISSRAVNDLTFAHCFVTKEPMDKIFISSKTSTNAYVFPLFVERTDLYGPQRKPNFSRRFLGLLTTTLGLRQGVQHAIPEELTPEDIFHFAYAVFHSPGYRNRYEEFLKIDFPRLPLTGDLALFRALARLGGDLVALHLLEDDYPSASWNTSKPKGKSPLQNLISQGVPPAVPGWQ